MSTQEIAENLAKEYIVKHNYDYTTLNKHYSHGVSPSHMNFAFQLAEASANEVVNEIKKKGVDSLKDVMKHFSQVALAFNDSEFAFSLDTLKKKITQNFPELSNGQNLSPEAAQIMIGSIKENENYSKSKEFVTDTVMEKSPVKLKM